MGLLIPTFSHSHAVYSHGFPVPFPVLCRDKTYAKHYHIEIMQFHTQLQLNSSNTSSNIKRLLPKNTLSMSPFTESQLSCHVSILLRRNSRLVRRFCSKRPAILQRCRLQSRWELFPVQTGLFHFHPGHFLFPFPRLTWCLSHSHGIPIGLPFTIGIPAKWSSLLYTELLMCTATFTSAMTSSGSGWRHSQISTIYDHDRRTDNRNGYNRISFSDFVQARF